MLERLLLIAMLVLGACDEPASSVAEHGVGASVFAEAPQGQWRLPGRLREISGLATTPDGRVFGHDDEKAVIYQIDVAGAELRMAFSVGEPVERGDFEGLAITPTGDFWLTTSAGRLYRFREGADGAHVAFDRFDTGLGDICEVEGLAYLASAESLILACKTNHAREMRETIALYAWPIGGGGAALWRAIPERAVAAAAGVRKFRPSGIEFDLATGRILLLSANDGALAEFDPGGELIAARRLGREHVQAEGVTIGADGALIIADEGAGGHALISSYGRDHD